jgi:integrase
MVTVKKHTDGARWIVRWDEWTTIQEEGGGTRKDRKFRGRLFDRKGEADDFAEKVNEAKRQGENYVDAVDRPTVTIGAIGKAYVRAAVDAGAPVATQRNRGSLIGAFLTWAGEEAPASRLSRTMLEAYSRSLPSEGRKAATRHRKVLEAERMWAWAATRPDTYPGVPTPCRISGTGADEIKAPPPVARFEVPTFEDVDTMIACLTEREWHRRAATLLRFSGLRVGQILHLDWRDVDLTRGVLRLRAGVHGAKAGAARVVPLHPDLAAEMATWDPEASGLVFTRPDGRPWREDRLAEPFRRAWELSKVPRERWDAPADGEALPGDRAHGSPSHAIRAAVKSGLIGLGVAEPAVNYLIGHKLSATDAAYVPQNPARPEDSPRWSKMVAAVAKIPPIKADARVIPLTRRA